MQTITDPMNFTTKLINCLKNSNYKHRFKKSELRNNYRYQQHCGVNKNTMKNYLKILMELWLTIQICQIEKKPPILRVEKAVLLLKNKSPGKNDKTAEIIEALAEISIDTNQKIWVMIRSLFPSGHNGQTTNNIWPNSYSTLARKSGLSTVTCLINFFAWKSYIIYI